MKGLKWRAIRYPGRELGFRKFFYTTSTSTLNEVVSFIFRASRIKSVGSYLCRVLWLFLLSNARRSEKEQQLKFKNYTEEISKNSGI